MNGRDATNLLVEERRDLLDTDFEISKPPTLLLDFGDLFPQLLLLRCEFSSLVREVSQSGCVDCVRNFEGREGGCKSGGDSSEGR